MEAQKSKSRITLIGNHLGRGDEKLHAFASDVFLGTIEKTEDGQHFRFKGKEFPSINAVSAHLHQQPYAIW